MRPKVVVVILLLAFGILMVAYLITRPFPHEPAANPTGNLAAAQSGTNILPPKESFVAAAPIVINTPDVTNSLPAVAAAPVIQETNNPEYVHDRIGELMTLAMNDDSNSFNTIWSELSNSDKEIRAGALQAVIQFGDHSVTNRLRDLADQTQDPAEKGAILQAADYLALPSISEVPPQKPKNATK